MKILSIKNLFFGYTDEIDAINDVSLDIFAGEYVAIIGHNGSGKSTLAKLIIGLLEKKTGTIEFLDEEITEINIRHIRSQIGIVFQNPDNQFIGSTVRDDIAFGLENNLVPHKDMDGIINALSIKVRMEEFLDQEPSNLSGGQKQRVAIAGVLAMNPQMIIFDEATAMLDPLGKQEIRDLILEMKQSNPKLTVLSITHDLEEASSSDRIIVLNHGKVYMQGTPKEIFMHKEELEKIDLDLPFLAKLRDCLKQHQIYTDAETMEEMVKALCQ